MVNFKFAGPMVVGVLLGVFSLIAQSSWISAGAVHGARADADLARQVIGKYTKTTDREDIEDSYPTFLPAREKLPLVPAVAVQTMLNFATHAGAKTAKAESFIDNSALLELEKSGFVERLYNSVFDDRLEGEPKWKKLA